MTREKQIILLPDETTNRYLENYPEFKKDLKNNVDIILSPNDSGRQEIIEYANVPSDKTHSLVESEIYKNKYYTLEEFDKKNAQEVADAVTGILYHFGVKKVEYFYEATRYEKTIFSKAMNFCFGYKKKAKVKLDNNFQSIDRDKTTKINSGSYKVTEEITTTGKRDTQEEFQNYIKEKGIKVENLPAWLRHAVEDYLKTGEHRLSTANISKVELEYNQCIRNKVSEIKNNLKVPGVFESSLKLNKKENFKQELMEFNAIHFFIQF